MCVYFSLALSHFVLDDISEAEGVSIRPLPAEPPAGVAVSDALGVIIRVVIGAEFDPMGP